MENNYPSKTGIPRNLKGPLPGWIKRAVIIALLTASIGYFVYINSRFLFYSAKLERMRSTKNAAYEAEKQSEEALMKAKSRAAVAMWYKYSDDNDIEGIQSLLSDRWSLAKNKKLLKSLLDQWIMPSDDIKRGYTGKTLRADIENIEVISNAYGTITSVTVLDESDLKDQLGHHILKGETVFVFERVVDEKGNKLNEVRLRDIFFKAISDKKAD